MTKHVTYNGGRVHAIRRFTLNLNCVKCLKNTFLQWSIVRATFRHNWFYRQRSVHLRLQESHKYLQNCLLCCSPPKRSTSNFSSSTTMRMKFMGFFLNVKLPNNYKMNYMYSLMSINEEKLNYLTTSTATDKFTNHQLT